MSFSWSLLVSYRHSFFVTSTWPAPHPLKAQPCLHYNANMSTRNALMFLYLCSYCILACSQPEIYFWVGPASRLTVSSLQRNIKRDMIFLCLCFCLSCVVARTVYKKSIRFIPFMLMFVSQRRPGLTDDIHHTKEETVLLIKNIFTLNSISLFQHICLKNRLQYCHYDYVYKTDIVRI